jgi:hypothetical protein
MKHLIAILMLLGACGQVPDESPAPVIPEDETAPSDETSSDEPVVADAEPIAEDGEPIVAAAEEFSGEWLDPVIGRNWLMLDMVDAVDAVCDIGYEVPDVLDLGEANANGLADELASFDLDTKAWAKNINNGLVQSWRDIADVSSWANVATGARLWCVEEN